MYVCMYICIYVCIYVCTHVGQVCMNACSLCVILFIVNILSHETILSGWTKSLLVSSTEACKESIRPTLLHLLR